MEKLKLLCIGDFHDGNKSPLARIDDFELAKKKLTDEINQIAKENNCQAILQLGDFLDKPKYPYEVMNEIINRWKPEMPIQKIRAFQKGEISSLELIQSLKNDIPLIGVVGNHELFGNSLNTLRKTSIYFLKEIGFMQLVDKDNPVILTDEEGFKVAITGSPYHNKMDHPDYVDDYIVEEKLADYHLHLVHGYASPVSFGSLFPHTLVENFIDKTKADYTLCGHDHIGFDLVEKEGKRVLNPGSPVLTSADEIDRKPKVALIEITKDGIRTTMIPLKTGSNGREILSREHIDEKKGKKQKLEEIKSAVAKVGIEKKVSITDVIEDISKNKNIDEKIRQEVIERVENKITTLTTDEYAVKPYTIKKILLKNFQSHKDSVIECHEGLNVFVGESRNGKTAIQRALDFVFEGTKKNPRNYIKKGETECSVTLVLSNGLEITRFIQGKRGGKNGYKIFDANTGETQEGNTKMISVVQQLLGFVPLAIDDSKNVGLNFLRQDDSWFFISRSMSAFDRAKVIGSFYGTQYADAAAKEYDSDAKKVVIELKQVESQLEQTEEQLIDFYYLETLSERIKEIEKKKEALEGLIKRYERIKELYKQQLEIKVAIERNEYIEAQANLLLSEQSDLVVELKDKLSRYKQIVENYKKMAYIQMEYKRNEKVYRQLEFVESAKSQYQLLLNNTNYAKQLQSNYRVIVSKIAKKNELEKRGNGVSTLLKELEAQISNLTTQYQQVVSQCELKSQIEFIVDKQEQIKAKWIEEDNSRKVQENHLNALIQTYRSVLEQLGQCPICQSQITQDTVAMIVARQINQMN